MRRESFPPKSVTMYTTVNTFSVVAYVVYKITSNKTEID